MKVIKVAIVFCIILIPFLSSGQSIVDDIRVKDAINLAEKWIEAQHAYKQIPGINLTLVYKEEVIWRYAVGFSNPENKTPTSTKKIHSICSISKVFTAIAIMQLRDQGRLDLDDPVSKHLSWFNIEQIYPDSPPITIRSLLTHSSGLPRESDFPYWNSPQFEFPSREEVMKQLASQKTLYPADRYYQYSNLGLTLAGEIVTTVSGEDYETYIKNNIINPLGMSDTQPEMPKELYGTDLAVGYSAMTREGTRDKLPFFQANAITPAAGFSSTADDLALFAAWQLRLLDTDKTEILKANTLREMQRVHWLDSDWKTTRGLGFGVYRNNDVTFVGHEGSCPGYRSALMIQPDSEIAVICMANASGVSVGKYAQGVHRIVSKAIQQCLDDPDFNQLPNRNFVKFTGTYSNHPWGGEEAIIPWDGGLAMAQFPSDEPPIDLTKLIHVRDNHFQRIRDDGTMGEDIIFIQDDNSQVVSMKQHSNYWNKIK
jgi:CubicO group peptidase (beta-lactamase class C family)